MRKAINIENNNKTVVRILSIAELEIIENNPTNLEYIVIEDFPEEPELKSNMSVNYPMYNKNTQEVIWVQVDYKYTATDERLEIENLKAENSILQTELNTAQENISMLLELQADLIGGAM